MQRARDQLTALETKVTQTEQQCHEMLEYFGEKGVEDDGSKLFETVHTFCQQFKQEQHEVLRGAAKPAKA